MASLSEAWVLSSNHSFSFSKVTKNISGLPGAKRHSKRPTTHSHLQMYWFIMTHLFLRAMQASMASEQSYFTASLMEMSDLSHMFPGPWTRLRKTRLRLRRKVLPLFLGSLNFTCISSDASSLCELITNPCWKYLLRILRLQFWLLLECNAGPFSFLRQYEIEYKSSAKVASADASSRLPLQYRKDASVEEEIFHVASQQ